MLLRYPVSIHLQYLSIWSRTSNPPFSVRLSARHRAMVTIQGGLGGGYWHQAWGLSRTYFSNANSHKLSIRKKISAGLSPGTFPAPPEWLRGIISPLTRTQIKRSSTDHISERLKAAPGHKLHGGAHGITGSQAGEAAPESVLCGQNSVLQSNKWTLSAIAGDHQFLSGPGCCHVEQGSFPQFPVISFRCIIRGL